MHVDVYEQIKFLSMLSRYHNVIYAKRSVWAKIVTIFTKTRFIDHYHRSYQFKSLKGSLLESDRWYWKFCYYASKSVSSSWESSILLGNFVPKLWKIVPKTDNQIRKKKSLRCNRSGILVKKFFWISKVWSKKANLSHTSRPSGK